MVRRKLKKVNCLYLLSFWSIYLSICRSKDGVVLSVNKEISDDRKKYEIINEYDLIVKTVVNQDRGRYLCQNFDQALSINVVLTVLSK